MYEVEIGLGPCLSKRGAPLTFPETLSSLFLHLVSWPQTNSIVLTIELAAAVEQTVHVVCSRARNFLFSRLSHKYALPRRAAPPPNTPIPTSSYSLTTMSMWTTGRGAPTRGMSVDRGSPLERRATSKPEAGTQPMTRCDVMPLRIIFVAVKILWSLARSCKLRSPHRFKRYPFVQYHHQRPTRRETHTHPHPADSIGEQLSELLL